MSSNDTSKQSDASDRQVKLEEILAGLMRAIDTGETVNRDEWLTRYPDFAAEVKEFFEKDERIEKLLGPIRQDFAQVLHVRCPHCHNPIELLEDAPLTDIGCPSCGSSFSLVGDNMSTQFPGGTKTVGHFELLEHVGIGQFGSVWYHTWRFDPVRQRLWDRPSAIEAGKRRQRRQSTGAVFQRVRFPSVSG